MYGLSICSFRISELSIKVLVDVRIRGFGPLLRRVAIVGFVTREFVQLETLERAKRWLIEVGFHPSRIELHTHGTPRITVYGRTRAGRRSRANPRCRRSE